MRDSNHTKSVGTVDRYGILTVTKREKSVFGKITATCLCDCGGIRVASESDLRGGRFRSCGCRKYSGGKDNKTHGHSMGKKPSKAYIVYTSMLARCNNERNSAYANYGGRGIKVCDRWLGNDGFLNFLADMGEPNGLTLDRIDNSKGYSPDNCRWATRARQARNRRSTKMIEYMGKVQSMPDWAEELGVGYDKLRQRISVYGWTTEEAFSTP